jgi:hypothetical protein
MGYLLDPYVILASSRRGAEYYLLLVQPYGDGRMGYVQPV